MVVPVVLAEMTNDSHTELDSSNRLVYGNGAHVWLASAQQALPQSADCVSTGRDREIYLRKEH